jgi:hypothetical protein|tara:strand:+ start:149 stop:352 length:204 start_codon:yes stop_codon:yes gene_type:complete
VDLANCGLKAYEMKLKPLLAHLPKGAIGVNLSQKQRCQQPRKNKLVDVLSRENKIRHFWLNYLVLIL